MIKFITGDLLLATEQYIAHQTNCVTKGGAGLAAIIFNKYPYSDVYSNREKPDVPGTISIHGDGVLQRYIINMFSQYYPGGAWDDFENDNLQKRKDYFKQALKHISEIPNIQSIAFPYKIGCGLAGGNWEDYLNLLNNFADNNPNINISIYQREGDV